MAASIYPPAPGSKYGPCEVHCEHRDCASMHAHAAQLCRICGKPIGYDNRVYQEDDVRFVHATCLEREVDQETKAQ